MITVASGTRLTTRAGVDAVLQQQSRGISYPDSPVDRQAHAARSVANRNVAVSMHTDVVIGRPWEDLFASTVVPRLLEVHGVRHESSRKIWHADLEAGKKLADLLLAPRARGIARYVDSLLERGASVNALYREVFEPAQRILGKLWDAERCDDFDLSIGLTRLGVEVRRVSLAVQGDHACKSGHTILLCPQPGEQESVGAVMSSEIFDRGGWEVTCEFPVADQLLLEVLQDRWFDVLKLSQSGSLRRDSRLVSLRDTIDAARVASLNPALMVVVDGRTFAENPQVYQAVHADAVSCSVLDAVPIAERLLDVSRSLLSSVQVTAS